MNKVIFWDFDGTLVYSEHLWSGSLLKTLERYTPDNKITLNEIRPPMAHGFSWDTPDENLGELIGEKWWDFTNEHIRNVYKAVGITEEETERLIPLFRKTILEPANYHLYPDTLETLKKLREMGFRHYMISNNYPELDVTANALGLDEYFDDYIISAQIGYDKPRREIFETAYLKADKPEKCLMVGDNPYSDIKGAEDFGILPVLVHNSNTAGYNCITCENLSDVIAVAAVRHKT